MTAEARVFKALAHETRLRILSLLALRDLCVCHFQAALGISQVAASRHLGVLRSAGLVVSEREGLWVHYRLAPPRTDLEETLLAWLRSRARRDRGLREDVARMRECVQMPLERVVDLVRQ